MVYKHQSSRVSDVCAWMFGGGVQTSSASEREIEIKMNAQGLGAEIVETTLVVSRVSFFEGRISYIRVSCNYPTKNANF